MYPLLANTIVHLAVGLALFLAWRQDLRQNFTKWLSLSFLVNAAWILGYALYTQPVPYLKWSGAGIWAVQQSISTLLLFVGARSLRGQTPEFRRKIIVALVLGLYLFAATLFGAQVAVTAAAAPLSLALLLTAKILFGGNALERIAAALLGLNALGLWIAPLLGIAHFPVQTQFNAVVRLLLGLTLILACLRKLALESNRSGAQLQRLIDGSHQSVMVVQGGRVVYANPAYMHLFGFSSLADVPAVNQDPALTSEDRLLNEARQRQLLDRSAVSLSWEQRLRHQDGRQLELRISAWRITWNEQPAIQVVISDETETRDSIRRMLHEASHDRLTGLPNRFKANELYNELGAQQGGDCALLLLNLANFSSINSALGYLAGDEFLKQVGDRLTTQIFAGNVLTRVGGDEFLVLVRDPDAAAAAERQAKVLLASMEQPFTTRQFKFIASAAVGIATCLGDRRAFDALLGNATLAAKQARQAGRNAVCFFDESMNTAAIEDVELGHQLHTALQEGQLELFYQPIVDARSRKVLGAEALLRWRHPQRGYIPPGRFIPVAERLGLIVEVGDWVLNEACRTLADWAQRPALASLTLSINVSTVQCARGGFDLQVAQALAAHQAPTDRLELEITESALISDPEQFVELLARLRAVGVRLAIDDFGTGYSNLSYLQRFKVDKLKVDQSFVRGLMTSPQDAAIVRAVIQLADTLGLTTTAEGVEDEQAADALVHLGCNQAQGYYFAKPMDRRSFEASAPGASTET